jgi:hypothetical protein
MRPLRDPPLQRARDIQRRLKDASVGMLPFIMLRKTVSIPYSKLAAGFAVFKNRTSHIYNNLVVGCSDFLINQSIGVLRKRYNDMWRMILSYNRGAVSDWWYVANGERSGPVSFKEICRLSSDGTIKPRSLVWKSGMKDWELAARIAELASYQPSKRPEIPRSAGSIWHRLGRHAGSSIAFLAGGLAIIGELSNLAQTGDGPHKGGTMIIAGIVMFLGALAYRSAKKRRLGEATSIRTRQFLEVALLVLICIAVLRQHNLSDLIKTDPVPNIVMPVWAILVYFAVAFLPASWLRQARLIRRSTA